jgi:nucleoside-diphosphate-sugar epimerase
MPDGPIDDSTVQRPVFFYGATKVFGEHMGLIYKRNMDWVSGAFGIHPSWGRAWLRQASPNTHHG